MSLINDALNRAQAEASNQEAVSRGEIPAVDDRSEGSAAQRPPAWAALVAAVFLVVALLAWRWNSTTAPRPEQPAEAPSAESATVPRPASPTLTESLPVRESAPPPDLRTTTSRPVSREPAPAPPVAAEQSPAQAHEQAGQAASERAPRSTAAEPETPEPVATEQTAEVAAVSVGTEVGAQPAPASRPTTIWPSDGPNQETWYFVGKVELAGGGVIELDGIAWSELAPSAMLNGSLLTVGSELLGLRIVSIAPRTVTLVGHGQRIALQLAGASN